MKVSPRPLTKNLWAFMTARKASMIQQTLTKSSKPRKCGLVGLADNILLHYDEGFGSKNRTHQIKPKLGLILARILKSSTSLNFMDEPGLTKEVWMGYKARDNWMPFLKGSGSVWGSKLSLFCLLSQNDNKLVAQLPGVSQEEAITGSKWHLQAQGLQARWAPRAFGLL